MPFNFYKVRFSGAMRMSLCFPIKKVSVSLTYYLFQGDFLRGGGPHTHLQPF